MLARSRIVIAGTNMAVHALVVLCVVAFPVATSAQVTEARKADPVTRFITAHAERLRGDEFEGARAVKHTGESGRGLIAIVALYTIEGMDGSNNYTQFLVAFLNDSKGGVRPTKPVSVGGKLYRAVELAAVEARRIVLKTTSYAAKDPACCPTIEGTTSYELSGDTLKETKASGNQRGR